MFFSTTFLLSHLEYQCYKLRGQKLHLFCKKIIKVTLPIFYSYCVSFFKELARELCNCVSVVSFIVMKYMFKTRKTKNPVIWSENEQKDQILANSWNLDYVLHSPFFQISHFHYCNILWSHTQMHAHTHRHTQTSFYCEIV